MVEVRTPDLQEREDRSPDPKPSGLFLPEGFGQLMEEAIVRAMAQRVDALTELARRSLEQITAGQIQRIVQASQAAVERFESNTQQIIDLNARDLAQDAERILEKTGERMAQRRQEILDGIAQDIREPFEQVLKENQAVLQEALAGLLADQNRKFAAEAQDTKMRLLQEIEDTARQACEQRLTQASQQFESQVTHSLQGVAEWLVSPS